MRLSTCSLVLQRSTLFRLSIWVLLKPLQAFEDLPLCLQLLSTAGWVKAELSSSSQGYARLPASRCVPALEGERQEPWGGCKAFQEQVWKLWHEWLNTLLLNLPIPIVQGGHIACMMGS